MPHSPSRQTPAQVNRPPGSDNGSKSKSMPNQRAGQGDLLSQIQGFNPRGLKKTSSNKHVDVGDAGRTQTATIHEQLNTALGGIRQFVSNRNCLFFFQFSYQSSTLFNSAIRKTGVL
jgi:hypothetical protein